MVLKKWLVLIIYWIAITLDEMRKVNIWKLLVVGHVFGENKTGKERERE